MKGEDFAILHNSPIRGQILIDTTYDHDTEQFKMVVKWWEESANGYAALHLTWADEDEAGYKRTFENMRSLEFADDWCQKIVDGVSSYAK